METATMEPEKKKVGRKKMPESRRLHKVYGAISQEDMKHLLKLKKDRNLWGISDALRIIVTEHRLASEKQS